MSQFIQKRQGKVRINGGWTGVGGREPGDVVGPGSGDGFLEQFVEPPLLGLLRHHQHGLLGDDHLPDDQTRTRLLLLLLLLWSVMSRWR